MQNNTGQNEKVAVIWTSENNPFFDYLKQRIRLAVEAAKSQTSCLYPYLKDWALIGSEQCFEAMDFAWADKVIVLAELDWENMQPVELKGCDLIWELRVKKHCFCPVLLCSFLELRHIKMVHEDILKLGVKFEKLPITLEILQFWFVELILQEWTIQMTKDYLYDIAFKNLVHNNGDLTACGYLEQFWSELEKNLNGTASALNKKNWLKTLVGLEFIYIFLTNPVTTSSKEEARFIKDFSYLKKKISHNSMTPEMLKCLNRLSKFIINLQHNTTK